MSVLGKEWSLRYRRNPSETLWAALMKARKIENPGEFFSEADLQDLHDPFLFPEMERAVTRLLQALRGRERVVVYGDYDVDGLSGTALLVHTLRMLGGEVSYRIPHRLEDGYGLHQKYVEDLATENVKVLITVDLGISCASEVGLAQELGIDVIIADHHSVPKTLPKAWATLHPKLASAYPCQDLSGSGVSFKLASALLKSTKNEDWIPLLTDLASLGTVADCVPLIGENRAIVKLGLKQMKQSKWDGLRALLESAGVWESEEFSSQTIGFYLGPRLNASGRLENPLWSLQTLLAEGESAREKSQKLEALNRERQELMKGILEAVEAVLETGQPILIAEGPWSSGIVGLVAGRLQEKYGKPAFILEDRGDSMVGSARSPAGFHCVEALHQVKDCLLHYGGHERAAGFSMKKEHYPEFKEKLMDYAKRLFQENPPKPSLVLDLALQPSELTLENCEKVASFAPFGAGNETPLFLLEDVEITDCKQVGKEEKHLKFTGICGKQEFTGIGFQFGAYAEKLRRATQLAVQLEKNTWNGHVSPQLKLVDFSG